MSKQKAGTPRASLSMLDGSLMMIGIIIGIGIFKIPQLVALNVGSEAAFVGVWVLGGMMTLIGCLVYTELAAAYPSTGGEYTFLTRAFGQPVGFLFAWARTTIIQTGAIAAVSFVLGDFAQQLYSLGTYGSAIYAGLSLLLLTLVNLSGTYQSKVAQNVLTALEAASLAAIALVGFLYGGGVAPVAPSVSGDAALGLAMVFVLFTYGGWNEAAYLSADMRNVKRDMVRMVLVGTAVVTVLYVLINIAYLHVLGLEGIRKSDAVAAAVMRVGFGASGAVILSLIVCCAAFSTINASIFTGARLYHALGEDLSLQRLRLWNVKGNNPRNAIIAQSLIVLALIVFGAVTRDGFQAMVEYTAPVFWFFLLLVGISYFILRKRDGKNRPFRAPLYPITPLLFCLTCAYLLYSSLVYTGYGALVGIAVLLAGIPLLGFVRKRRSAVPAE